MLEKKTAAQIMTIILSIAILSAILAGVIAWHILLCIGSQCDVTNVQALLIEGLIFAGGLGSYFYYLQRKSAQRTEHLVEEVHGYIEQNKTLIANIKAVYLRQIQRTLVMRKDRLVREKTLAEKDKTDEYRVNRIFAFVRALRDMTLNNDDFITERVNFRKSYIDPEIIDQIESSVIRFRHLVVEPYPPDIEGIKSWLNLVDYTSAEAERLNSQLESLISGNKPQ